LQATNNSLIFMIEQEVSWIIKVLKELKKRKMKAVVVKKSEEEKYTQFLDEGNKQMAWGSTECGSWYVNENGKVFAFYPKSSISYWNKTRRVNFEHFDFL